MLYDVLSAGSIVIIGSFLFANAHSHISLIKNSKSAVLVKTKDDDFHSHSRLDSSYRRGLKKAESICVREFLATVEAIPHFDLSLFYKNLRAYGICRGKRPFRLGCPVDGAFDIVSQVIEYYVKDIRYVIFHELFHMSSRRADENYWICGFHQIKKNLVSGEDDCDIGAGLDEGYTQLLTERYFGNKGIKKAYGLFVDLVRHIEILVGREKMEMLYSQADLRGLIDELQKYATYEDIIDLLDDLDYIFGAVQTKIMPLPKVVAKYRYQRVLLRLSNMFLSKAKQVKTEKEVEALKVTLYSLKSHIKIARGTKFTSTFNTKQKLDKIKGKILTFEKASARYERKQ